MLLNSFNCTFSGIILFLTYKNGFQNLLCLCFFNIFFFFITFFTTLIVRECATIKARFFIYFFCNIYIYIYIYKYIYEQNKIFSYQFYIFIKQKKIFYKYTFYEDFFQCLNIFDLRDALIFFSIELRDIFLRTFFFSFYVKFFFIINTYLSIIKC